jgi:hypothetical protein
MEDGMVYVRSQRVYVRSHTFHKKYRKTLSFRNPQIRSSNLIMSLRKKRRRHAETDVSVISISLTPPHLSRFTKGKLIW